LHAGDGGTTIPLRTILESRPPMNPARRAIAFDPAAHPGHARVRAARHSAGR
jgi:hypothetical protein